MEKNPLFVIVLVMSLFSLHSVLASEALDLTGQALTACLNDPSKGSTADQVDCEITALRSYDKRMNAAYLELLKSLPPDAAVALKTAQRSWISYRDMEAHARNGLFESRQGTMYAPMQADAEVALTKDRALLLERYVSVLEIDGP